MNMETDFKTKKTYVLIVFELMNLKMTNKLRNILEKRGGGAS